MNITDNAFGTEFNKAQMPDGSTYTRKELEEAVEEEINRIYK